MNFDSELSNLLEYTDYEVPVQKKLMVELKVIHQLYPYLWPNRGWGVSTDITISLTGHLEAEYDKTPISIPFGISFPKDYPKVPPLCNILTQSNHVVLDNPRVSPNGDLSVPAMRDWNSSSDSIEVLIQCVQCLCDTKPWFNLDDVFLAELWRKRTQIEEVNQDSILLMNAFDELQKMQMDLDWVSSEEATNEIKVRCKALEYLLSNPQQDFALENLIEYKKPLAKQILSVLAEIETIDELLSRLEEALSLKVLTTVDYFFSIKKLFNERFMLNKMKEKLLSLV
jgi:ubiquitin-protein ligase